MYCICQILLYPLTLVLQHLETCRGFGPRSVKRPHFSQRSWAKPVAKCKIFLFKISQAPVGVRSSHWNHMLFGSYAVPRMQEIRCKSLVLRDHRSELNIILLFSLISGFATGFGQETHKKCGRLVFFESSTNRKLESWYRTASLFTWTRTWNITLEVIPSSFTPRL